MPSFCALLLTLASGIFFIVGFTVVKHIKRKEEASILALGLAFAIMLGMVFFDIIPEIIQSSNELVMNKWAKIFLILLFIGAGGVILKIFDHFLPNHTHKHHAKENIEEHKSHKYHVGLIMAFSLILHNMLEGMSMYVLAKESISAGFLLFLGVGLHNLPFGIEIQSSIESKKEKKSLTKIIKLGLLLSTFLGGFLLFLLGGNLSNSMLFFLLSITCGMILYIALFELLNELMNYRKNKLTYIGVGIGILFVIVILLLG